MNKTIWCLCVGACSIVVTDLVNFKATMLWLYFWCCWRKCFHWQISTVPVQTCYVWTENMDTCSLLVGWSAVVRVTERRQYGVISCVRYLSLFLFLCLLCNYVVAHFFHQSFIIFPLPPLPHSLLPWAEVWTGKKKKTCPVLYYLLPMTILIRKDVRKCVS